MCEICYLCRRWYLHSPPRAAFRGITCVCMILEQLVGFPSQMVLQNPRRVGIVCCAYHRVCGGDCPCVLLARGPSVQ